jgi:hypothetical protein
MRLVVFLAFFFVHILPGFGQEPVAASENTARISQISSFVETPSGMREVVVTFSPFNLQAPLIVCSPDLSKPASSFNDIAWAWADAGYFVVAITHDDSMGAHSPTFFTALRNEDLWKRRAGDIKSAISWTAAGAKDGGMFGGLVRADQIGLAGHGFGGYGVSALAGMKKTFGMFGKFGETIPNIKALMLFGTPSSVARAPAPGDFAAISSAIMVVSGTRDHAGNIRTRDEDREGPFVGTKGPGKYVLLFDADANDYISGRSGRFNTVADISSAFWHAYLSGDAGWVPYVQGVEVERATTKSRE